MSIRHGPRQASDLPYPVARHRVGSLGSAFVEDHFRMAQDMVDMAAAEAQAIFPV